MKKLLGIFIAVFILLTGCQTSRETFYWGNYSATLYELKRNPDDKTIDAHKKELLLIVEKSGKMKKQVPPGVYAEYGYILLKEGNEIEGMEYLTKEETSYPESAVFIKKIKAEYERGKK